MFETTSTIAEKLATRVSRRGFLGSLGRWAGATAFGLAGVLTTAGTARADSYTCCTYYCFDGVSYYIEQQCIKDKLTCPPPFAGCYLNGSATVANCKDCPCKNCSGGG